MDGSLQAIQYELFVPGQPDRERAVQLFFEPDTTEEQRENVIRKYSVSWIVLNPRLGLYRPGAVRHTAALPPRRSGL